MKAYLANGLFSESDVRFNTYLASSIRRALHSNDVLYVPQEQGINDKSSYADAKLIYELDKENLMSSDVLIAVIDGVEIDAGVALEIGLFAAEASRLEQERESIIESYWHSHEKSTFTDMKLNRVLETLKKPKVIIGLYTDSRQQGRDNNKKIDALIKDATENQFMYRNLMVIGAIKAHGIVVDSSNDLVEEVKRYKGF